MIEVSQFSISRHKLVVSFKTPVHVGTGETISRFDYFFNSDKNSVLRVNSLNFVLSLPESERALLSKVNFENPSEVFRAFDVIFARNMDILRKNTVWITGVTGGFAQKYRNLSSDSQREIRVLTRTGISMKPCLPGSSIKGSISTAILFHLKESRLINQEQFERYAEKAMLGDSPNSALGRLIKISDALPSEEEKLKTYVFYIKKVSMRNPSAGSNLYQFADCLFNCSSVHDLTIISLPDEAAEKQQKVQTFGLKLDWEFIAKVCNDYYGKTLMPEIIKKIGEKNISEDFLSLFDKFRNGGLGNSQFLLQVGWGGGIEGITLLKKKSRTVWAVEDEKKKLIPMGWCLAEFKS